MEEFEVPTPLAAQSFVVASDKYQQPLQTPGRGAAAPTWAGYEEPLESRSACWSYPEPTQCLRAGRPDVHVKGGSERSANPPSGGSVCPGGSLGELQAAGWQAPRWPGGQTQTIPQPRGPYHGVRG